MNDLERAAALLADHTVAAVRGDEILTHEKRGVAPLVEWVEKGVSLAGFSVADRAVGRAAALLYTALRPERLYAPRISEGALAVLADAGIPVTFGEKVPFILNRTGKDICPMEKATRGDTDAASALVSIRRALEQLK